MNPQNYEIKNQEIVRLFNELKESHPERLEQDLNLSWSNWGFGMEPLAVSVERLSGAGVKYIELHGNHYGPDLGYRPEETLKSLSDSGIEVSGICGMFSIDNDLSGVRGIVRQNALDYLRRELEFAAAVGADYLLVVPGAVGRPGAYDDSELLRSAQTLRLAGDNFAQYGLKAAIEPIRAAEVSLVHTIADAQNYLNKVAHPAIAHLNGDVYHMSQEESHIGEAIIEANDQLVNLHMADSNRCALGDGALDLDMIIMSLYLIGYNCEGRYVTFEPLGPGGDPYPAMHGMPDPKQLDKLVGKSVNYFRNREKLLKGN